MKTVTFCGHSEVEFAEEVRKWLESTVEALIKDGAETFLLGGYGAFDRLAADAVWKLKKKYPDIKSLLVLPYLDRRADSKKYDVTIYPPMENMPKRFAIVKRNQWMVREADVLVAYVLYSWGGAVKTLEYARKRKKGIIGFA